MSSVSYAPDPRCYLLIAQNSYIVFISFAAIYINSCCIFLKLYILGDEGFSCTQNKVLQSRIYRSTLLFFVMLLVGGKIEERRDVPFLLKIEILFA